MHGSLEPGSKTAAKSGPAATGRRPSGPSGPKETQRSQQQQAAAVKGGQAACPGGSLDSCIGRQKKNKLKVRHESFKWMPVVLGWATFTDFFHLHYGYVPLTTVSGSGSCYFRLRPSRHQQKQIFSKFFCLLLFEGTFKDKKVIKKSQNSRNQVFSYYFCSGQVSTALDSFENSFLHTPPLPTCRWEIRKTIK